MSVLANTISELHNLENLTDNLRRLGSLHDAKKVKPEHFEVFGRSLVLCLKAVLGPVFTAQMQAAWQKAFGIIVQKMTGTFCQVQAPAVATETTPLDRGQVAVVQQLWLQLMQQGENVVSKRMFTHLFRLLPEALDLFGFQGDFDIDQAPPLFETHRKMVVRTVGNIIMNFNATEEVARELKKLGQLHLNRGVEAEHYDAFGQAFIQTVLEAVAVNEEERQALELVTSQIASGIVSDNFLTKEWYVQTYAKINLSKQEMDEILGIWKKQVFHQQAEFGLHFFKKLFSIYPELARKFPELEGQADAEEQVLVLWEPVLNAAKNFVATMEDVHILFYLCTQEVKRLEGYGFTAADFYMMKEALLMALEEVMQKQLSNQAKTAIVKFCKLIRNFVVNKDLDDCSDDEETKLTTEKLRVLQQSWSNLKKLSLIKTG